MDKEVAIDECPIEVQIDVQWRDLDVLAHVNNAEYIKWFECARIAALQDLELLDSVGRVPTNVNVGPILGSITCKYLKPVGFPARVRVGVYPSRLGTASFNLAYIVVLDGTDEVVAVGDSVVVNYDYGAKRSAPLGDAVRRRLKDYLQRIEWVR